MMTPDRVGALLCCALIYAVNARLAACWAGQPRVKWKKPLPKAVLLKAQDGVLLAGGYEGNASVIEPASGRTLINLKARFENARVSQSWVISSYPASPSDEQSDGDDWIIESQNLAASSPPTTLRAKGRPTLGDVSENRLYYSDSVGLQRARLSSPTGSEIIDEKAHLPISGGLFVRHGTIYFNPDGHRIFGILANDPKRGWWNYCDCTPVIADDEGVYGTGTCSYGVIAIKPDGEFWQENTSLGTQSFDRYDFNRICLAIAGDRLVIGGRGIRPSKSGGYPKIVSPYLFAFNKHTGKLLWKVPMEAGGVCAGNGRIIVWAGHNREYRLEIRSARDGALLWRDSKRRDRPLPLAAIGRKFYVLENGVLTASEYVSERRTQ